MGITRANQRKTRRSNLQTLDQTFPEVQPNAPKRQKHAIDPDLPGLGQFYCIPCSRYFVDQNTLDKHAKSKFHKKRLRQLKEKPYDHEEAMRAAGMGVDHGKPLGRAPPRAMETETNTAPADAKQMVTEDPAQA